MAELALELLNLMAALCILYCVVRLTPTLNLRLQRRAVQLLLLATTTFFVNEVLGVLGVFWVSEGLAVLRDGLEMTFIFSLAIALLLLFQSDRCEVATLNQAATVGGIRGVAELPPRAGGGHSGTYSGSGSPPVPALGEPRSAAGRDGIGGGSGAAARARHIGNVSRTGRSGHV
jgi:hypothetical protein